MIEVLSVVSHVTGSGNEMNQLNFKSGEESVDWQKSRLTVDVHPKSSISTNMPIASQSYVFLLRNATGQQTHLSDPDTITLIFAHATGFHKEHWEPTLNNLHTLLQATNSGSVKVQYVWSIDTPNHGDAAVLNEKALKWGYDPVCMCTYSGKLP